MTYSKNWAVMEFGPNEDRALELPRRVYTAEFPDIQGVRVWLAHGYAKKGPTAQADGDVVTLLLDPVIRLRALATSAQSA